MTGPAAPPPPSPPGPTGPGRHLRAAVESATPAAGASTYPVVVDAPTGAPGLGSNESGGPVRPTSVSRPFVASGGSYGYVAKRTGGLITYPEIAERLIKANDPDVTWAVLDHWSLTGIRPYVVSVERPHCRGWLS